jgi:hypothetical protein
MSGLCGAPGCCTRLLYDHGCRIETEPRCRLHASCANYIAALDLCGDIKTALAYLFTRQMPGGPRTPERCREALAEAGGRVRDALLALAGAPTP